MTTEFADYDIEEVVSGTPVTPTSGDHSPSIDDETALHHVMRTLLGVREPLPTQPMALAFVHAGIRSVDDLIMMDAETIDDLTYEIDGGLTKGGNPRTVKARLTVRDAIIVKCFTKYARFLSSKQGSRVRNAEWIQQTQSDFDDYRVRGLIDASNSSPAPASAPPTRPHSTTPSVSPAGSKYTDFAKSIKRDKSHYADLKDEQRWEKWKRDTYIQAQAHGVAEVLDASYKPTTTEEKLLFLEKQKFMMSVFNSVLQTDMGKTIVQSHATSLDAQQVYKDLCTYMSQSASAEIQSQELFGYIINSRYDPKVWTKGTVQYVMHWRYQVRQYNNNAPTGQQLEPSMLITILHNAIQDIPDLRAVKTTAQITGAAGVKTDFTKYYDLVLAAATHYDEKYQTHKRQPGRLVNIADSQYDSSISLDVDTPPNDILQIYTARGKSQSSPAAQYSQLAKGILPKAFFDSLSDDQRNMWLKLRKTLRDAAESGKPSRPEHHDADAGSEVFVDAPTDPTPDSEPPDKSSHDEDNGGKAVSDADTKLLSLVAAREEGLDAADIRRIMSTSLSASPQRSVNNVHRMVSRHSRKKRQGQLFDRGASGGIVGDDLKILEHTSNPPVSVIGLDNHEIINLPIVNAVGVAQSQHGPVIIHFNQYAYHAGGRSIHSVGQIEAYNNEVCDRSRIVGGKQRIITTDGYIIPLQFRTGLPEMDLRPPTDDEMTKLPHTVLTSDEPWDPTLLDFEVDIDDDVWYDTIEEAIRRHPDLNIQQQIESTTSGYVNMSISTVNDGSTGAQAYVPSDSLSPKDETSKRGAIPMLVSDSTKRGAIPILVSTSARSKTDKKIKDILYMNRIHRLHSETHHQSQNSREEDYQYLLELYVQLFGEEPNMAKDSDPSPLSLDDHPDFNNTDLLSPEDITKYTSLIESLQWLTTLGHSDIHEATMIMSKFSSSPRRGHLERLKHIVAYIKYTKDYKTRVRNRRYIASLILRSFDIDSKAINSIRPTFTFTPIHTINAD